MSSLEITDVTKLSQLHQPDIYDVAEVLEKGLLCNFSEASVKVVDCPDLTCEPFHLAAAGLGDKNCVADIGGVPWLMPLVHREKIYDFKDVAEAAAISDALVIGAGAGPSHTLGFNSELIANVRLDNKNGESRTHVCYMDKQTESFKLQQLNTTQCNCLCNVYMCEGKPGKVLEVIASHRTGELSLYKCMGNALADAYGTQPVALGGTFCLTKGTAKIHVMSDFSTAPLDTVDKIENWLQYFTMSAPLTSVGYLISHDPGWDLRTEHFHCFSTHGEGGHYHYDTSPEDAQYLGYFNIAQTMVRVDPPTVTHKLGRD